MYIQPNTIIRVLNNCPLDKTYDHTLNFSDISSQTSYFQGLTKYTFSEQTYQRVNSNIIRVQRTADDLYDCNYLMFQNSAFGNKWFYAFITSVEYVNNITAEIEYELDVMQTWYFNYDLKDCFIEREHSETDNIGDNLVPENLEIGDYISDGITRGIPNNPLGNYAIVVAATFDSKYQDIGGTFYTGVFSGLMFHTFTNSESGAMEAAQFIQGAVGAGKQEGIVSVFLMSSAFISNEIIGFKQYDIQKTKNYTDIDGYVPKNNKLFTYPYNFLYCTNFQGTSAVFKYEYFSEENCTFNLIGDTSCNPSVVLRPTNYKGVDINNDEKMVLSGFPQLAYNTDSFKAWLAQNASSIGVNAMSTTLSAAISGGVVTGGTGAVAGAIGGVALSVASILSQVYQASIQPNQAKGGGSNQSYVLADIFNFGFMHKYIRAEFAKIIDDYFNMFGYACHRVKTPNINSRPHWNYVKTLGCVIEGSIPANDISKICQIYNSGITFWHNPSEIGNYALDNSPTGV